MTLILHGLRAFTRPGAIHTVIDAGGWGSRFAVVRAVRTLDDHAAAVIDANGDGADINLEHFKWTDGQWHLCSSSGGAGNWGRGWHDGFWAEHDRNDHGWWLTLEHEVPDADPATHSSQAPDS